jgi:hypothetical protein
MGHLESGVKADGLAATAAKYQRGQQYSGRRHRRAGGLLVRRLSLESMLGSVAQTACLNPD